MKKVCYTYNMEIYAVNNHKNLFLSATSRVKRMTEPLFGSGHNITADNWFTGVDLVDDLKKKKLTYVGTVKNIKDNCHQNLLLLM